MGRIADAGLSLFGQFLPAVADRHAEQFQPPQQRCGVLQVHIVVRRRPRHRLIQIADVGIVTGQCGVKFAEVQLHQCAVPPQMVDQIVAKVPMRHLAGQPVAAFLHAAISVEHMRLDVVGEVVGAIGCQCCVECRFGGGGVADFLVGEGPDGLKAVMSGNVGAPGRRQAICLLQDRGCLAMAKPDAVGNLQGEQVGRMCVQYVSPGGEGPVHRARFPRGQRRHVQLFAPRRRRRRRFGDCPRRGNPRPVRRDGGEQQQVCLETVSHQELRILGHRLFDQTHRVGVVFQVVLDGAIEQHDRGGAVGRKRQSAFIALHQRRILQRAVAAQRFDVGGADAEPVAEHVRGVLAERG
ncbi:MAG TPA: hypothetical protein VFW75_03650 [Acetobacteraceae bacterium]|nr:hypothetical protein [Acetobacteraceae bacterium]